jgi:hypothetical protein
VDSFLLSELRVLEKRLGSEDSILRSEDLLVFAFALKLSLLFLNDASLQT